MEAIRGGLEAIRGGVEAIRDGWKPSGVGIPRPSGLSSLVGCFSQLMVPSVCVSLPSQLLWHGAARCRAEGFPPLWDPLLHPQAAAVSPSPSLSQRSLQNSLGACRRHTGWEVNPCLCGECSWHILPAALTLPLAAQPRGWG